MKENDLKIVVVGGIGRVDMLVTPTIFGLLRESLDLELPLLHGVVDIEADGRHHCVFEVDDWRLAAFQEFMRQLAGIRAVEVTVMGHKVYKN